jgi:cleavage and polyadenylation specificity factor subunit 1
LQQLLKDDEARKPTHHIQYPSPEANMNCYTELTHPTAVSHSISLPLLHAKAHNLVVAKSSLLQVFELKSVVVTEGDNDAAENGDTSPQDFAADTLDRTFTTDVTLQRIEHATKLILVGEFPLAGTVSSLGRVKLQNTQSGGEALLVAFRDAKLTLVQWDPERHTISTISIHYYENSLAAAPWAPDLNQCPSYLTVDPSNRCSVLRFGPRHLAIVPFRQPEDDLIEDDFDSDLDDPADRPTSDKKLINGDLLTSKTPYGASFVLPLTVMDPEIIFPIHLAFLHEYREPTFGILYSTRAPSTSMTLERRDLLRYKVFTLDLEQQASTTILSVSQLPTGLHKIVPLPLPVGGALLLGNNEIVHIDQAGKSTAIAVNEFAKTTTTFPMNDLSNLALKLEGCAVESLGDGGDLLLVLTSGELAILSFKLDGRSVAGLSLHKVLRSQGGGLGPVGISCSSNLGRGKIFLGSEDSDSLIIGWSRKTTQLSRKRSHADMLSDDSDISFNEDDIEDDDDIYGGDSTLTKVASRTSTTGPIVPDSIIFRVHDKLPNLCPSGDVTFGRLNSKTNSDTNTNTSALQLVYPNGRGHSGGIAISRQELDPVTIKQLDIPSAQAVWAFHATPPAPKGLIPKGEKDSEGLSSAEATFDKHLIASSTSDSGGDSYLYDISSTGRVQKAQHGDFETEGATVDIGTLSNGTRIVQVKISEVRCYNSGESNHYLSAEEPHFSFPNSPITYTAITMRVRRMFTQCVLCQDGSLARAFCIYMLSCVFISHDGQAFGVDKIQYFSCHTVTTLSIHLLLHHVALVVLSFGCS